MAESKYTPEQRAAYKAGLAASKKKAPAKTSRKPKSAPKKDAPKKTRKKRSGCTFEESYTIKATGEHIQRPRIKGWRKSKDVGYQKFTAFLGKNDGQPKNPESRDRFVNFVVNLVSQTGTSTENAVYDKKYKKLKFIEMGLVANANAKDGGYFGPGGARLKAAATK